MKKTLSTMALAAVLSAAFAAPSFGASFDTAAGAKKPQPEQVVAKKKAKRAPKKA